jgi:hypothetical protein
VNSQWDEGRPPIETLRCPLDARREHGASRHAARKHPSGLGYGASDASTNGQSAVLAGSFLCPISVIAIM